MQSKMSKTILVTGGTGFIGSWVVKYLLEEGNTVRLTLRNKGNKAKYEFLESIAIKSGAKLEIWEADLLKEGCFDEAAAGCDMIYHLASPFILKFSDAEKELILPALKGTENVLNAATKSKTVKRIVLTSSVAAIFGDNADMKEQGLKEFTEANWNTSSSATHQQYSYSKTLAEKRAWEMEKSQSQWSLVVINPSFVIGPSLEKSSNSGSLQFMNDLISGKYRMGAPNLEFSFVDVRDVAKAHILAAENTKTKGRFIIAAQELSMVELVKIIENAYPKKLKLPLMTAPKFSLFLVGWAFGLSNKFIARNVGHNISINSTKSKVELGIDYYPIEESVKDMIKTL